LINVFRTGTAVLGVNMVNDDPAVPLAGWGMGTASPGQAMTISQRRRARTFVFMDEIIGVVIFKNP
jgi:hypothetical protein